jgi:hypothetical protein
MNLQVNLLKKTEQRYQGIVSMQVIMLGSGSLFTVITILAFLLAGISKMKLGAELDRARHEWARLEPLALATRAAQSAAAANNQTLSSLKNWAKGDGSSMYGVLRAVQKNVPAQMELYHFSVGAEQESAEDPRTYALRISGTANGERTVIEAKRRLNEEVELRKIFGEIKLISSQRHFGEAWAFALEGRPPANNEK